RGCHLHPTRRSSDLLFSAITMESVSKATYRMIEEVRRQFKEDPGILKGESRPDYNSCVGISTTAALREMLVPGIIAVAAPLAMELARAHVCTPATCR